MVSTLFLPGHGACSALSICEYLAGFAGQLLVRWLFRPLFMLMLGFCSIVFGALCC